MAAIYTLLLLLFTFGTSSSSECKNVTALSLMIDSLLASYDREAPPSPKVVVNLTQHVRHATIRETDSTVRLMADLEMNWMDSRLIWNSSEWDCESWPVSSERLWIPDVVLLNAAASTSADVPLRAHVTNEGLVSWIKRLDVRAPIAMQYNDWPNDQQTCVFKYGSRMHSSAEMDFTIGPEENRLFETGTWEVTDVTGALSTVSRADMESRVAMYQVTLRRRAPAHSLTAAAVFVVVLLLLLSAAILPPASRPPLAAAAAFISIMWQVSVLSRLGEAGSAPRVAWLQAAATACAAAFCLTAAFISRIQRCTKLPPPPLKAFISTLSRACDLTSTAEESCESSAWWGACGRVLDRVLVLLLLFTLFILLLVYCF